MRSAVRLLCTAATLLLPNLARCQSSGQVRLVSSATSSSGLPISVIDTETHRVLLLGHVVIGAEYLADWAREQAAFSGMALMQTIAFLQPAPKNVLALGLGSGTAPTFLRQRGIATDIIEIDDGVLNAASAHCLFGEVGAPGRTIFADALTWLTIPETDRTAAAEADSSHATALPAQRGLSMEEPEDGGDSDAGDRPRYSAVLSDLFDGGNPTASISHEHFSLIKRKWLLPGGVLALNIVAFGSGQHARLAKAAARTLRHVFGHVLVFADHDVSTAAAYDLAAAPCNLIFFASDAPIVFAPPADAGDPPGSCYHLHAHFGDWQVRELAAATHGEEGEVLSSAVESTAPLWLREDSEAVRAALPAMQRGALPDEGWAMVERLMASAVREEAASTEVDQRAASRSSGRRDEL